MVDQKIIYGLIGVVSMLFGATGMSILSADQLDHAYVCTANEKVGIFDRLSSTSKTGYWIEDNVTKSAVCTNGIWISLKNYAADHNFTLDQDTSGQIRAYSCTQEGCKPIN